MNNIYFYLFTLEMMFSLVNEEYFINHCKSITNTFVFWLKESCGREEKTAKEFGKSFLGGNFEPLIR